MPPPSHAVITATIDVTGIYNALNRAPRRNEVVAILIARVQDLLAPADRAMLTGIDNSWADKASQIFNGLLQLCPTDQIIAQLGAAFTAPNGVAGRRLRFQFARALPQAYGPYAYSLAYAMVAAAAEASQDPDIVAAITAATVTAVSPASGATTVPVTAVITATFSEAMDPTTIDATTILLANPAGAQVAGTVTYDDTLNKATLTPAAALISGVTYTVLLRGGATEPTIKDIQGMSLASNMTWSFTTA